MSLPPAIPLVTHGDCPHCGQRLLGLAQAKCGHCGRSLVPAFETLASVGARLQEMAPGWTVAALLDWVRPRPAQLAWVHQNQQWPLLSHFVAEGLWASWQQWEQARRTRGVSLQVEDVQVSSVHLVGLGEWHDWALIRIHGQRTSFQWSLHSSRALDGSTEPTPFTELWRLSPTGAPAHASELRCAACGGEVRFDQAHCGYCGSGVVRSLGPWALMDVQILHAGPTATAWGERGSEDWEWVLENLIC